MADLASGFLRIEKVRLHRRSVSVVAHSTLFEYGRVMSMNFGKLITFVALEAAAFKHKATVLI
jgi:hypothetical protein